MERLKRDAIAPEGPLQLLQGILEIEIQLVVHTIVAYERHLVRLPDGSSFRMSELGYEGRLCNMALVSAVATWEGFCGNILRIIRSSGQRINKQQLPRYVKQTTQYQYITEPLARRDCIVHNFAKVDNKYKLDVPDSTLNINDSVSIRLPYLRQASTAFFNTGVALTTMLIQNGLLPNGLQKTIGEFQNEPGIV